MIRVPPHRQRSLPLLVLFVFSIFYFSAATLSLWNDEKVSALGKAKVDNAAAEWSLLHARLYSGSYFQQLAERLQFYPHRANIVEECYRAALHKSPADYKIVYSYARYLEARACCKPELTALTEAMVARSPKYPESNLYAAQLFLRLRDRQRAFRYFRQAQESGAVLSPEIYRKIESDGEHLQDLFTATPHRFSALLNLAGYLLKRGDADVEFHQAMGELNAMPKEAAQRLMLARLALQSGDSKMAQKEVLEAQRTAGDTIAVLQLLADIAAQQHDWTRFRDLSARMRDLYRKQGKEEQSCELALKTAGAVSKKAPPDLTTRLMNIIETHPRCVPAYVRMAEAVGTDDDKAEHYLKIAAAMAPQNFEVANRLARLYIKQSKYADAEATYLQFLETPDYSNAAYLGLAHCRTAQGNYASAELALKEGIERNENPDELWRELGKIYTKEGRLLNAAEAYSHFASLTPERPEGFLLTGDVYKKMGRLEAAKLQYEKALAADAENRKALQSIRSLDEIQ